ncbi:MAG TPA: ABC transporter ATP-binding protein [Clostridiaceae bacterium]|jgi:ATP-binding cassette subfamily B protein|nr:ABC transporter ATP-binding protein [Clostridiaceae bacterium]
MDAFKEEDYSKQFDIGLWKKLLRCLIPYKKLLVVSIGLIVLIGAIDAVFPLITRYAIDNFIMEGKLSDLIYFAPLYGFLIVFQSVNVFLHIAVSGKIEMGVCYDLRETGFKRLQELSYSYYDRTPVGWIMARMTSDVQRLSETLSWGFTDLIWGFSMMVFIMAALFAMNWKLALISLSVVPVLAVVSVYFQKRILDAYRVVRKTNSQITGGFNEGIQGARTTKTLVREKRNLGEFEGLTGNMRKSAITAAVLSALYMPLVMILGSIGTGLALWFGGQRVMLEVMSYGTLVAFISYTVQFFEPIREMARIFAELQYAQASAERVMSLVDTEPEIVDSKEVIEKMGDVFSPKVKNWPPVKGDIKFENVTFKYKDGEKVLENFNLHVRTGETIALVGETGSGKSTIVNLVCRFYEPTEGRILIDNVDYRNRSQLWLQSNLGYVLQTPHLFSGTIRENIRYGRLDATDEEVEEAARLVHADEFIKKLEKQYDTEVGEGGGRLSTGEKQLISFARAILANPRIFVLDEATSSIDTETEQIIQSAIQKVLKGRTSFIIAHRLSTIRSADRILVIRDGKIIEEGNHYQLIKKKGYYYNLYTNQFKEEQEKQLLRAQ